MDYAQVTRQGGEEKQKAFPTISVIIPVYNVEKYLIGCLESVIRQSIPFQEIILINDGSTDNSRQICERYCERHENIIMVNQNNQGLSVARNTGLKRATCDYVLFLDSDDMLDKVTNEKLISEIRKVGIDVALFEAKIIYDSEFHKNFKPYVRKESSYRKCMTGMEYFEDVFPEYYHVSACLAIYKRSFLIENRITFPEGVYFEDNYFHLQVIMNAEMVMTIPYQLYIRRYREGSIMTSAISKKKCEDISKVCYLIWKYVSDNMNKFCGSMELLKAYLMCTVCNAINYFMEYGYEELCSEEVEKYKRTFWNQFAHLYDLSKLNWTEANIWSWLLWDFKKKEHELVVKQLRAGLMQILKGLQLNDCHKKIAIYGIGLHTKALFNFYTKYVGEAEAEIYFLVSKKTTESYMGREIFEGNNIQEGTDFFIISSNVYKSEMYEKLLEQGVKTDKIRIIYSVGDICDLVFTEKIMGICDNE